MWLHLCMYLMIVYKIPHCSQPFFKQSMELYENQVLDLIEGWIHMQL
jgi:hypothetical protein